MRGERAIQRDGRERNIDAVGLEVGSFVHGEGARVSITGARA